MIVFFDFEVKAKPEEKDFLFEGKTGILLKEIKEFIKQRLKVLEDEMESEEAYVCIFTTPETKIYYGNASEGLRNKMNDCISREDIQYILNKIWDTLYPGKPPPK